MKLIDIHISKDKVFYTKNYNSKIVAAIGNFDGLHKGHEKLLKLSKKDAANLNLPFGIVTFDPHPRDFFLKSQSNFLLTDFLEKKRLFQNLGIDYLFKIKFNDDLRILNPENFVELILKNTINTDCIYAGENFRFGKNREGSFADKVLFQRFNIDSKTCKLHKNKNDQIVSSQIIRKSILSLDFKLVKSCLGRNWALTGNVKKGDQNGRKLGFATANLELLKTLEPRYGVYFTRTRIMKQDGSDFTSEYMPSITNFGIRPTLDGQKKLFETHILDYENYFKEKDIYDHRIYVEVLDFLRDEKKFNSFEDLKGQISKDVETAKLFHKNK
ncbi:riboflavin biosynthesis protein RibF [Alphaproteobacteria bacterium]|nr:riboflavin biosynthesis protein RibF [Alphaproteobacteria bacterium]